MTLKQLNLVFLFSANNSNLTKLRLAHLSHNLLSIFCYHLFYFCQSLQIVLVLDQIGPALLGCSFTRAVSFPTNKEQGDWGGEEKKWVSTLVKGYSYNLPRILCSLHFLNLEYSRFQFSFSKISNLEYSRFSFFASKVAKSGVLQIFIF